MVEQWLAWVERMRFHVVSLKELPADITESTLHLLVYKKTQA